MIATRWIEQGYNAVLVLHSVGLASSTYYNHRARKLKEAITEPKSRKTRAGKHPLKFLAGFRGYLSRDGYAAYKKIPNDINVGCWSHVHRRFDEAVKVAGMGAKNPKAKEGLKFCNQLFTIEKKLVTCEPEKRYDQRLQHCKPVLEVFWYGLKKSTKFVCKKVIWIRQSITAWTGGKHLIISS